MHSGIYRYLVPYFNSPFAMDSCNQSKWSASDELQLNQNKKKKREAKIQKTLTNQPKKKEKGKQWHPLSDSNSNPLNQTTLMQGKCKCVTQRDLRLAILIKNEQMRHNSTVHNYRDTAMWSSPLILSWQYFLSTNKQKQPNKMNQYNQCFLFTFDDPQEEKAKEERQELEEAPGRCPNPRRRLHRQPSAQSLPQRRSTLPNPITAKSTMSKPKISPGNG